MNNLLKICLLLVFIQGCSLFSPNQNTIKNIEDLEKSTGIKHSEINCDFDKIAKGPSGEHFCSTDDNANYVSYFVSYNYQVMPKTSLDFLLNLTQQLDKDNKKIEKSLVQSSFYNKNKEDINYNSITPTSFVTEKDNKLSIFISKNDVLLRKNIYPSLVFKSLEKPKEEYLDNLPDYKIKFLIYPHLLTADYTSNWISAFLGIPSFSDVENLLVNGKKDEVFKYFDNLENKSSKDSNTLLKGTNISFFELARPFVFHDKIEKANKSKNALIPSLPSDNEGFINEYLPSYTLNKIEIIKKSENDKELVIKKWDDSQIRDMILNNDETSGFYFDADKTNDKLIIRYTHKVNNPRYRGEGYMRSNMSGLSTIYENLKNTIVTDINVAESFKLKDLPLDCINKVDIKNLLDGASISAYKKEELLNGFTDAVSSCSLSQIMMTKVIFYRHIGELTKK